MKIPCKPCEGTGLKFPRFDADCDACEGTGLVEEVKKVEEPKKQLPDLVQALCDIEDLPDWESGFAGGLAKYFEDYGTLTDKQVAKAEDILKRYEK